MGRVAPSQLLPPSIATTSWIGAETFCLSRHMWHCEHPTAYPASRRETRVRCGQKATSFEYGCVYLNCSHGKLLKIRLLVMSRTHKCAILVGVRGLEPPTSASRTLRASRLRYTPKNDPRKRSTGYPPANRLSRLALHTTVEALSDISLASGLV
jgi:hypothetical protein